MRNIPNLLERFTLGKAAGSTLWSSEFKISHRINDRMQYGSIFFAGDAAHEHSSKSIETLSGFVRGMSPFTRMLRQIVPRTASKIPLLKKLFVETVNGFDHDLNRWLTAAEYILVVAEAAHTMAVVDIAELHIVEAAGTPGKRLEFDFPLHTYIARMQH